MKNPLILTLICLSTLAGIGCYSYRDRAEVVDPHVVVEKPPGTGAVTVRDRVITTLPSGYRTRVYRGTTYYEYGNTYYRTVDGGYVIVPRPW